jgi:hypothetical protein
MAEIAAAQALRQVAHYRFASSSMLPTGQAERPVSSRTARACG